MSTHPLAPLDTRPLFRPLLAELLALLRGLDAAAWERPTVASAWRVRDVAAHLLDGDLRKLAAYRDDHAPPPDAPIASDRDLARHVNALNASGVAWARRLSPRLVVDLLAVTGGWAATLLESLDPDAPARWPVSWAGETASANWMDTGREYTERWHHQMQIRDAVGAPLLLASRWLLPLLDLSVRALPAAYAPLDATPGTAVTLEVSGETSGAWTVVREEARWAVRGGRPARPDAVVRASADDAWRLFYNALPPDELARRLRVEGRGELARPLLGARSIVR